MNLVLNRPISLDQLSIKSQETLGQRKQRRTKTTVNFTLLLDLAILKHPTKKKKPQDEKIYLRKIYTLRKIGRSLSDIRNLDF